MKKTRFYCFAIFSIILACQNSPKQPQAAVESTQEDTTEWSLTQLEDRARQQLNQSAWDTALFRQDIATYEAFGEYFRIYPLNKSPFPVATYDFAVYSEPFTQLTDSINYTGVRIGEYESMDSEEKINKLNLLIASKEDGVVENTFVDSRNYPYLTAQGVFSHPETQFDWVFSSSPDGYAMLMVNMKLFDLRFGNTVVIYPQKNGAFYYKQTDKSPDEKGFYDAL